MRKSYSRNAIYVIYRIAFVIFLAFIFHPSYSQKNYVPGTIISLESDTINGLIDYQGWIKNPRYLNYKNNAEGTIREFHPGEIQGFNVMNEKYISAIVQKEVSPHRVYNLEPDHMLKLETDTVFLHTLISGRKSLYYFVETTGKTQFYILDNDSIRLLIHKKYSQVITYHDKKKQVMDDMKVIRENNIYRGQLALYLGDCNDIQGEQLAKLDYSQKDLEKIFMKYYNCIQSVPEFREKVKSYEAFTGVIIGTSFSAISVRGKNNMPEYLTPIVGANFSSSVNITAGLLFEIRQIRNNGKWSLVNELLYTSYDISGNYTDYDDIRYDIAEYNFELGYSYIKLITQARLRFISKSVIPYINFGFTNGFAVREENYKEINTQLGTFNQTLTADALIQSKKYEAGLTFGAGVQPKKLLFEARYELSTGVSDSYYLSSPTHRLYFLVGYIF